MEYSKDTALALEIHNRLNNKIGITENAIIPEDLQEKDYEPRTLIDNTLELIDPTPNIHTLFVQFNAKYFWNKLLSAEVKWSNRMTTCAGVCSFHPRTRQCVITVSAPLLKLRPRKDLVETLLHEMIHGYLFLTNNDRDRDGHGPEFHKHMHRINKEAGTHITVYHNFHDEVRLYQQHWWLCNGPCQKKPPYFGTVRRAMNRAPGPTDTWWNRHQQTCGGQFMKIREPAKPPPKNEKPGKKNEKKLPNIPKSKDISDWLTKSDKPKNSAAVHTYIPTKTKVNNPLPSKSANKSVPLKNDSSAFTKLGNNLNNIHGWGIGGPNSSVSPSSLSQSGTKAPKFHGAGVLGGSGSGKSNLLNKFSTPRDTGGSKSIKIPGTFNGGDISAKNAIVDLTRTPNKRKSISVSVTSTKLPKIEAENISGNVSCPVCNENINISALNEHLDQCLVSESSSGNNQSTPEAPKRPGGNQNESPPAGNAHIQYSPIVISDSSSSEGFQTPPITEVRQKCLVCDNYISRGVTLTDHLETCIGSLFTDDSFPKFEENDENTDSDQSSEKNYPCPICMALMNEHLMNEHLDMCLNKDLLEN